MQKILIVEDDIDIQDILKNHLIDAGYEVAVASDGVAGIAMFDDTIDLVLLDIMLPKIDGYGVCEVIRKRSQVPIIMLTALSDEENQLRGFEQQIDDYIPKPFSPKILLCKIAAILRRRTAENQNQSLLTYKELSMDVDGFHVYQGGNEVVLTSKEFALLRLMLENQGKVFTRQMLLDRLWADDLEIEDRIVDSHIKNIRKKLNADYILFKEQGEVLLLRFANDLEEYAKVEQMPLLEGKRMTISLAPKKAGSPTKAETDTAKKENPKKAVETKE